MTTETFLKIKHILDSGKFEYKHLTHDYVRTSDDAAHIRDTNINDALKAIILKAQTKDGSFKFVQAVIPANERIDLKKLKLIVDSKNVSLASPQEVLDHTKCTVGSVPPFAHLFNMKVYLDESALKKDLVVFSAGTHTDSIKMKAKNYFEAANPDVVEFKKQY